VNAIYDLSRYPASFNFIEFLVASSTRGATHVVFDTSLGIGNKFSPAETKRRLDSIVFPACALARCSYGPQRLDGDDIDPGYHHKAVQAAWLDCARLNFLTPAPVVCDPVRYTVTIRASDRYPMRNSNESAWRAFAADIGALVIEDYAREPIDLHKRMAIYAGAEMNFGVANGPMALLWYSEIPYCVFMKNVDPLYHGDAGPGLRALQQLPWANKRQCLHWRDDTAKNIRASFQ
jgi:hypothetical protein